ncbi:MAG: radical SAM protein [Bdellovibrionota bacterium]
MREPKIEPQEPLPPALLPHAERPPAKQSWTLYSLFKGWAFLAGIPADAFVSIDVTNECNMRCTHCYFFEQDHPQELTDEQLLAKLDEMKRTRQIGFLNCAWVGGEPLLRRNLLDKARHYFRWNTIVTNGTIPLPNWERTNFYVSIDGPKEIHEKIRVKGCYDRIKKNIAESGVPVTLSMAISQFNAHTLESLVEEWRQVPNVKNWTFDFFTPIRGLKLDAEQWMGFEVRDGLVDRLVALKRRYPDFIATTEEALRLMKSERCKSVTDTCIFREKSTAFSPLLEKKPQCMMGDKADCDRCGCVVPFYLHSISHKATVVSDLARNAGRKLGIVKEPARVQAQPAAFSK